MMKRIFSMPLRTLQGFINSVFMLARVRLQCPHYTCISRRAKQVEVSFKPQTPGVIRHLAIDATGLKVYGEEEWKAKNMEQTVNVEFGESSILPLIRIPSKLSLRN